jgi:hypothetical protein
MEIGEGKVKNTASISDLLGLDMCSSSFDLALRRDRWGWGYKMHLHTVSNTQKG